MVSPYSVFLLEVTTSNASFFNSRFLSCLKKIVFMVDYLKNPDVKLFLLIVLKDMLWIIPESYVLDLDTSKFFTALHIRVLPLSCVKEHFNKQLQNCQCLRDALVGSVYCTTQCPMDTAEISLPLRVRKVPGTLTD